MLRGRNQQTLAFTRSKETNTEVIKLDSVDYLSPGAHSEILLADISLETFSKRGMDKLTMTGASSFTILLYKYVEAVLPHGPFFSRYATNECDVVLGSAFENYEVDLGADLRDWQDVPAT